jgi:hypothetical protein
MPSTPRPFRESEWFVPIKQSDRRDHPSLPGMISGVYAIRDAKSQAVLYVGESHTDRLRHAIQNHLKPWFDQGRPREFYDRDKVEVAWYQTPAHKAKEHEAYLIRRYCPRDNTKGEFEFCELVEQGKISPDAAIPEWAESGIPDDEWIEAQASEEVPF